MSPRPDHHADHAHSFRGDQLASIPVADVSGAAVVRMLDGAVASLTAGPFTMISDLSEALMSKEVLMWALVRRVDWFRVKGERGLRPLGRSGRFRLLRTSTKEQIMRFYAKSVDRPKTISKRLKRRLPEMGYEIRKSGANELLARMFGYRNWNDLLGNIGKRTPTPYDQFTDTATVAARRAFYIDALVDWGCTPEDAAGLVDEIGPTSTRRLEQAEP